MHETSLKLWSIIFVMKICESLIQIESIKTSVNTSVIMNITLRTASKQYLDVDADFPYDIDHKFSMQIEWFLEIRRKWIDLMKTPPEDSCQFVKHYIGYFWTEYLKTNRINSNTCFFQKGKYHTKGLEVDVKKLPSKILPKGRVKIMFKILRKENQFLDYMMEVICINN